MNILNHLVLTKNLIHYYQVFVITALLLLSNTIYAAGSYVFNMQAVEIRTMISTV